MTTLYTRLGYEGPWAADDTAVTLDGYLYNGTYIAHDQSNLGGPTVDGRTYFQTLHAKNTTAHAGLSTSSLDRSGLVRGSANR
jgi:hypothetical protein